MPPFLPTSRRAVEGRNTLTGRSGGESDSSSARGEVVRIELDRQRAAFARRMAESKATAPHFYLGVEVEMDQALEIAKESSATVNDLVLRATALALADVPEVNGAYRDGGIELYSQINLGFAVATESSVLFPTLFDADLKPLADLASESRALAGKARDGSLTAPEFTGSTFTVSNLGMHEIDSYTPILNPPQAATLGVASLDHDRDGNITLPLNLACDHRILRGPEAARFLGRIRSHLEEPSSL